MWPVSDEEIRNLGESQVLVANISPSDGTLKLKRKSRSSKSYIEFKTKTLRDQCHQTTVSSQSCFTVLSSQSSERLPVSFGEAKRRRYLVGGEHFSKKKKGGLEGWSFGGPQYWCFQGFFRPILPEPFHNNYRPHILEISLYFNSFQPFWRVFASADRHFFSSWSFIVMSGLLVELDFFFGINRHFSVICPPLWCCTLCRYFRGCKRRPCRVYRCSRTFLIQGNHLSCDRWFLCSGVKVYTLGSYIIITRNTFWMLKVRQ